MFKQVCKIFFALLITIFGSASMATEITIINGGSSAGVTFMESQAISNVLSKNYQVNFINPGNACVAQSLVQKNKGAVLFIWDSTYEASARVNNPACQIEFNSKEIIRTDTLDWRVCSLRPNPVNKSLISKESKWRIGHANPASLFAQTVAAINLALGSSHVAVHYSTGLSSLVTALQNKEIDYAIISTKFANKAQEQGVVCEWTLDAQNRPSLPSFSQHVGQNSPGLVRMYQVLLVGKNFDAGVFNNVKSIIRNAQETPGNDLFDLYKGLAPSRWDHAPDLVRSEWLYSVEVNIVEK